MKTPTFEIYKTLSPTEKRILWFSTLMFSLCLLLLSPWAEEFISGQNVNESQLPVIGKITSRKNETLHKRRAEYFWRQAKNQESLRLGDSLYSGPESQVDVLIDSKNSMSVGENSLIIFDLVEKDSVANFHYGNFRLKVDGSLKVAIQGEITEFTGSNSELQVYTDSKNQPQARVIKGSLLVKSKKSPTQKVLNTKMPMALSHGNGIQRQQASAAATTPPPLTQVPPPQPAVPTLKTTSNSIYTWKLYDLYEIKDMRPLEKKFSPNNVKMKLQLSWTLPQGQKAIVETSAEPRFVRSSRHPASADQIELNEVFVGENFWRASSDGKSFSQTEKFFVQTQFNTKTTPLATSPTNQIPLLNQLTRAEIHLQTLAPEPLGFLVQASHRANFGSEDTQMFWSGKKDFTVNFFKSGDYYYRFKTIDKNQELSTWSRPLKFTVFVPQHPTAPKLAQGQLEVPLSQKIKMKWDASGVKTRVEISDQRGRKIKDILGKTVEWLPSQPGDYSARAWTVNIYGQESPASKTARLKVFAALKTVAAQEPKPTPSPSPTPEPKPIRKTAAVESTNSTHFEPPQNKSANDKYNSAELSVNGFMWSLYSSEQYSAGEASPIASGLGLHGLFWKGHHGVEGSLKSGVMGLNSAGATQTSLKDLEARYHYRFITGSPWGYSRELQFSLFSGFETYRNAGGSFASQYNLIKFGTSLDFPWSAKWTGGGEFVAGAGTDQSKKYEVSGHFGYFLKSNWSLGAGYRVHLFDAGSAAAAPLGSLPYREGYTEGYSILKYHF